MTRLPMREMLIANDDGVTPFLTATKAVCIGLAQHVHVVVPDRNCSGCGAAITMNRPVELARRGGRNGSTLIVKGGWPADGVRFALREFASDAQFTIAGVNRGYNLGRTVVNSGTIGVALESARANIPAIAVSSDSRAPVSSTLWRKGATVVVRRVVMAVLGYPQPTLFVASVTLPSRFRSPSNPEVRVLDLSRYQWQERYERRPDGTVVLRGERTVPDDESSEMGLLSMGIAVVNLLPTPWSNSIEKVRDSFSAALARKNGVRNGSRRVIPPHRRGGIL